MKLPSLSPKPNSYIHDAMGDLYISAIGLPILRQENIGGPLMGIYKSLIYT